MKKIIIENHIVPAEARSVHYRGAGSTVIVGSMHVTANGGGASSYATDAARAESAQHAASADHATLADEATHALKADEATAAGEAQTAVTAKNLDTGSSDWLKIENMIKAAISFIDDKYLSRLADDTAKGKITFEDFIILLRGFMLGNKEIVSVIQRGEPVKDDDTAIMTVAKLLGTFLRKDTEDETKHLLRLMGGVITTMLRSETFNTGFLGEGFSLHKNEAGRWYFEIDELYVRVKAVFEELEIRRLTHVGGNLILTPAACTLIRVEKITGGWRCYIKADDGTTATTNSFVAGDQARVQTFNIKAGVYKNVSNRFWWRLVTGVGDDYIDVSESDSAASSDAPQAGDVVVQLGNRNNPDRQHAILIETYGSGTPFIAQYEGIDHYALDGKLLTRIGKGGNIFTGDFYLNDGRSVVSVINGKMQSVISETIRTATDKDNYLSNGSFADKLDNWEYISGVRLWTVRRYIQANRGALSRKDTGTVYTADDDGNPTIRIINSYIKQLASNYASKPEIKVKDGAKVAVPVRIILYYKCAEAGTLAVKFEDETTSGYAKFEPVNFSQSLTPDSVYKTLEIQGYWSGTGDLKISFTGDLYLHYVILQLNEYTYYETRITQTAEEIRAEAKKISQTVDGHTDQLAALSIRADGIEANVSAVTTTANANSTKIANLSVTVDSISGTVSSHTESINALDGRVTTSETKISTLEQTAESIKGTVKSHSDSISSITGDIDGLESDIKTVSDKEAALEITVNGINGTVSSHTTSINSLSGRVTGVEDNYSTLSQTVNGISSTVSSHTSTLSGFETRIGTLETTTSSISGTVSDHTTTIGSYGSRIGSLEVTADSLTTAVRRNGNVNMLDCANGLGWQTSAGVLISNYDLSTQMVNYQNCYSSAVYLTAGIDYCLSYYGSSARIYTRYGAESSRISASSADTYIGIAVTISDQSYQGYNRYYFHFTVSSTGFYFIQIYKAPFYRAQLEIGNYPTAWNQSTQSIIKQTADQITISADRVDFIGKTTINGNFVVDTAGNVSMKNLSVSGNSTFEGIIKAKSGGTIGGFNIGDYSITVDTISDPSQASFGNLAIYKDFFRVGGSNGYVMFGDDVIPATAGGAFTAAGRVVNKKANAAGSYGFDQANYGLFIDVSGGTKNYGIKSNAVIRANCVYGDEAARLYINSSTYTIDLSQHNVFFIYLTTDGAINLPTKDSIKRQFGYGTLPTYFAYEVTFIAETGTKRITLNNVIDYNNNSTNLDMEAGDVVKVLVSNYPTFRYKVLTHYN